MEGMFDGWKITEEQKRLINRRDRSAESRAAFDLFFHENFERLYRLARTSLRIVFHFEHNTYKKTHIAYGKSSCVDKRIVCLTPAITERNWIEESDLLNSLYADYLSGYIILKLEPHYISGAILHSFRYEVVGGLDGVAEYKPMRKK